MPAELLPHISLEKSFQHTMNKKLKGDLSNLHAVKKNFLPLLGIKSLFLSSIAVANNFEIAFKGSNTFFEIVIGFKHTEK